MKVFEEQIRRGGPVTVTHPEMRRYFMTIPEAVQLVIQAGALGKGGEIFVLDMGEPVRILDLARSMIELSGYTPDVDMPIVFTGRRPGEKLFEELFTAEEGTEATMYDRIHVAKLSAWELNGGRDGGDRENGDGRAPDPYEAFARDLKRLEEVAFRRGGSREEYVEVLRDIVRTYRPDEGVPEDAQFGSEVLVG